MLYFCVLLNQRAKRLFMGSIIKLGSLYLLVLILSSACMDNKVAFKNGDILFRGQNNSTLSSAINEVTQTGLSTNYTHMGIVQLENDSVYVIHAAPKKGVCKELLSEFCLNDSSVVVDLYRLNGLSEAKANAAICKATSLIGNPYNTSYILDDEGYYCSEFVYEVFAIDSVFELEPMTFIDPSTSLFHSGWIQHYEALGIDIPEGQLGCNPNGLASSKNIQFVKTIH